MRCPQTPPLLSLHHLFYLIPLCFPSPNCSPSHNCCPAIPQAHPAPGSAGSLHYCFQAFPYVLPTLLCLTLSHTARILCHVLTLVAFSPVNALCSLKAETLVCLSQCCVPSSWMEPGLWWRINHIC